MKPEFFKIDTNLFINLNLVASVWWEEETKDECIFISMSGESDGQRIKISDKNVIIDLLSKLNIKFDHIFYEW